MGLLRPAVRIGRGKRACSRQNGAKGGEKAVRMLSHFRDATKFGLHTNDCGMLAPALPERLPMLTRLPTPANASDRSPASVQKPPGRRPGAPEAAVSTTLPQTARSGRTVCRTQRHDAGSASRNTCCRHHDTILHL